MKNIVYQSLFLISFLVSAFSDTSIPSEIPTESPTSRPTTNWFDFQPTHYVQCDTTKGSFVMKLYRDWSPNGVDHLVELVSAGFYSNTAIFRSVPNFIAQYGISDNADMFHFHSEAVPDDPILGVPFYKYTVSFAGGGENSRTTQLFIVLNNYEDFLGYEPWETPLGTIFGGKSTLKTFYSGYGDFPPYGHGPVQRLIYEQGSAYLNQSFPNLDYVTSCYLVDAPTSKPTGAPTTSIPTEAPTTSIPTEAPTSIPSEAPIPTEAPTSGVVISDVPSEAPTTAVP